MKAFLIWRLWIPGRPQCDFRRYVVPLKPHKAFYKAVYFCHSLRIQFRSLIGFSKSQ
jgi:hypothetical protein